MPSNPRLNSTETEGIDGYISASDSFEDLRGFAVGSQPNGSSLHLFGHGGDILTGGKCEESSKHDAHAKLLHHRQDVPFQLRNCIVHFAPPSRSRESAHALYIANRAGASPASDCRASMMHRCKELAYCTFAELHPNPMRIIPRPTPMPTPA